MRRPIAELFCLLAGMVLLAACGGGQQGPQEQVTAAPGVRILKVFGPTGSKAAFDAFQTVFEGTGLPYELRVFEGDGTEPGIQGVLDGTFDLMVLMRYPKPGESLAFIEFVRTPVAFFVNPSTGISNLTREQAVAILCGDVTNWSEVGGADLQIVGLRQEDDDTSTEAVLAYVMDGKPFVTTMRMLITDADMLVVVNGIPGAIGYASWAGKKYSEFLSPVEYPDAIMLDGLPPDDPAYPLVSTIGVAFRPDQQELLQPLFDWGEKFKQSGVVTALMQRFGVTVAEN